MTTTRTRLVLAVLAVLALVAATPASAAAPGLAITVPLSASFGAQAAGGGSFSSQLGAVTVKTSSGGLLSDSSWLAKVSTSGFSSGSGPDGLIPPGSVRYSAGAPTSVSGVNASACLPGPPAGLIGAVTAYSCSGLSLLTGSSVTWNPTITIQVSATNTVGIYSGTITHSVA